MNQLDLNKNLWNFNSSDPIALEIVKKIRRLFWNTKIHCRVLKSLLLYQYCTRRIHSTFSYPVASKPNLTLACHLISTPTNAHT